MSVAEDFSQHVREQRRMLWKTAQDEKEKGAKVKLIYDKLSVNGAMYGWDSDKKCRFQLKSDRRV